jgi:hypothetical protein
MKEKLIEHETPWPTDTVFCSKTMRRKEAYVDYRQLGSSDADSGAREEKCSEEKTWM